VIVVVVRIPSQDRVARIGLGFFAGALIHDAARNWKWWLAIVLLVIIALYGQEKPPPTAGR
jgi:hypothetical protein